MKRRSLVSFNVSVLDRICEIHSNEERFSENRKSQAATRPPMEVYDFWRHVIREVQLLSILVAFLLSFWVRLSMVLLYVSNVEGRGVASPLDHTYVAGYRWHSHLSTRLKYFV